MIGNKLSSQSCSYIGHRNVQSGRILRITKREESKVAIEFPSPVEMIAVQHIEHNGGSAHLVRNAKATRHGINYQRWAKAFALHIFANGNRPYVDYRDIQSQRI